LEECAQNTLKLFSSKIQKIEGPEGFRKLSDLNFDHGLQYAQHLCIFEMIDYEIDEAIAGYSKKTIISIHADG
jgi:DNA gyrase/topoisomerase IV subunit B